MKKLLRLLLLVCMVLPMTAYAETPVAVQGDFTYVPTGCEEMLFASDNVFFVDCTDEGTWSVGSGGDFEGTSSEEYMMLLYGVTNLSTYEYEHGFYTGRSTFDGTLHGMSGTLDILFVGTSPGYIGDWSGTWRILSGTGELADLHGQGIFYNNTDEDGEGIPLDIHIEGQVH